jgi:hypothetical protein
LKKLLLLSTLLLNLVQAGFIFLHRNVLSNIRLGWMTTMLFKMFTPNIKYIEQQFADKVLS